MIRAALAVLAALSLAACGGQEERWPSPRPALWEVSGPSGQRGWLFGTIHALPDGARWQTPAIDRALGEADTLVVEVADLADSGAGARAFAQVAESPNLPPLLQRLPEGERPALTAALRRAGLRENDFSTTESWAAALIIANAQDAGEADNGVDRALLARGLPVVGLEGFAEQFAIFDRLPPPDQSDLLHLAALESTPEHDRQMTEAWLRGDTAALEREAGEGILADPELRRALLVDRNRAWLPRIAGILKQGHHPVVAVGAAHMLGDVGLPALLARQGYTVRRIQ
jgi:uncharacterized protein YbaP (TraB family)